MARLADAVGDLAVETAALFAAAEVLERRFRELFSGGQAFGELLQIGVEDATAGGACGVRLLANASDGALNLLAAVRAGNGCLAAIGVELDHLAVSGAGVVADATLDARVRRIVREEIEPAANHPASTVWDNLNQCYRPAASDYFNRRVAEIASAVCREPDPEAPPPAPAPPPTADTGGPDAV